MRNRRPRDYKPIKFPQLYAITKMVLQEEPSMDDAEWKARTLERLERLEFDNPELGMLASAMSRAEITLKETLGPRPIRPIPYPPTGEAQTQDPPQPQGRTNNPEGWGIVVKLMANLRALSGSAPTSPRPPASQTLDIAEDAALDEFWRQMRQGCDRLALLRAFAEVAIVRPTRWNQAEIRAVAHKHSLISDGCFVCRTGGVDWHHVIQIQHGGSNTPRNRVPLCSACHARVHPWLPAVISSARSTTGWSQVAECAPEVLAALRKASA